MKDKVTLLVVAIVYIAIIYRLVRPNSKGPAIVQNIGSVLTDLVRGATGETYSQTTNKWSTGS
jgi:hypothetical protein